MMVHLMITTTTGAPTSVKVSEEEERPNVRFNIGDRVECHMDDKTCQPGYITAKEMMVYFVHMWLG